MNKKPKIVITFGTFDLFHVGHLRILQTASQLGTHLVVGVSSDALSFKKKTKYPVMPIADRMEIVGGIGVVNEVFVEDSFEKKAHYIRKYKADLLVMGADWKGKFDEYASLCKVRYVSRTPNISTSELLEAISRRSM